MAFSFPFKRLTQSGPRLAEHIDRNFVEATKTIVAAAATTVLDEARIDVLEGRVIPNGTITPSVPHTSLVYGTQSGATSSISYVNMATDLVINNFVKAHVNTALIITVHGHCWVDDVLVNAYIGVSIDGAAETEMIRVDTTAANYQAGISGSYRVTGTAAGTIPTIRVKRKVGVATTVFTPNGYWSLTVTETW